jgi:hypothetical protein
MLFITKLNALLKIFGFVYFICNIVICAVMVMFAINAWMISNLSMGYLIFLLPLAGIFTGYWIRKERYGWWRSMIIGVNIFLTLAVLFTAIFISPKMQMLKQNKVEASQKI